ncbi:MAG: patatin-like phospholipase family protein [Spirochaetales bacterium]|nr:patatin-like phospholipase family protein [Spirochaetales bacterium]
MSDANKKGLILAGGGAKGVYQIGVMKAFSQIGLKFDSVAGASVGALNAALYVQEDFDAADQMWESIKLQSIIDIPDEAIDNGKILINKLSTIHKINKVFIKDLGFNTEPLRNLIRENIDEEKIRRSKIDLGVVTFNLTTMKPVRLFVNQMEKGKICDYLLASASFPLFKRTKIDGKTYIDGGVYDNMPYSMLKKQGYKDITIVDVSGFGKVKDFNIENTITTYIKNSIEFGNFKNLYRVLDFSPSFLSEYKLLGYLDTMKLHGELDGIKYFFKKEKKQQKKLLQIFLSEKFMSEVRSSAELQDSKFESAEDKLREIMPEQYKMRNDIALGLIECAASTLNITPVQEYKLEDLIEEIYIKYTTLNQMISMQKKVEFQEFFEILFAAGGVETSAEINLKKTPYEYMVAADKFYSIKRSKILSKNFYRRFPQVQAGTLGIKLASIFLNK